MRHEADEAAVRVPCARWQFAANFAFGLVLNLALSSNIATGVLNVIRKTYKTMKVGVQAWI